MLKIAALSLLFSTASFAADLSEDHDQAILLAPTAPSSSVAEAPSEPLAAGKLSFGVGTGFNSFGGNMGKLVSKSSPVVDLRGEWTFSSMLSARAGVEFAKYSYNAAPTGAVEMSTNAIQAGAQWHYLSTAQRSSGFDPYASLSASQVFRSQNFLLHNSIEKDNALGMAGGAGTNFLLDGKKLGLWIEADAGQIFFQDRHESQFLESGIEDTTGLLYSARLGMKYYF